MYQTNDKIYYGEITIAKNNKAQFKEENYNIISVKPIGNNNNTVVVIDDDELTRLIINTDVFIPVSRINQIDVNIFGATSYEVMATLYSDKPLDEEIRNNMISEIVKVCKEKAELFKIFHQIAEEYKDERNCN